MAAHLEPAYADHPHGVLPVTEKLTTRSLVLPLFHDMTEEEQDIVVSAVRVVSAGDGDVTRVVNRGSGRGTCELRVRKTDAQDNESKRCNRIGVPEPPPVDDSAKARPSQLCKVKVGEGVMRRSPAREPRVPSRSTRSGCHGPKPCEASSTSVYNGSCTLVCAP